MYEHMQKKITIFIAAIFITTILTSTITTAQIANSKIKINTTPRIEEPLKPSESKETDIELQYKINFTYLPKLSNFFFLKTRPGILFLFGWNHVLSKQIPNAEIDLKITKKPEWCTATLQHQNLTMPINTELQKNNTKLTLTINKDAPALNIGDIEIKAEFATENWSIADSSDTTTTTFISAYQPSITYELPTELEIPPLNETSIPINITNQGNGETKINIKTEEKPENCNITLEKETLTIPADNKAQTHVSVTPDKNFENETINLKFTSKSNSETEVDEKYLKEETVSRSLIIKNDGSLKGKEEIFGIPGFETITMIILIAVIALFLKRRKE